MHIIIGLFIIAHGLVHLVGFLTYWRIVTLEEMPYTTTLFSGKVDVGDVGIRIMGILWLLTALAFSAAGLALIFSQPWWQPLTLYTAIFSLILTLTGWPDARFGVLINLLILAYLFIGGSLGWLPVISD
jgi:hypothetical protein